MATTKVSALSALTTTDGNEELLINDGGTSKKVTIDNVLHDSSIRSEHYADGSIDEEHIADDAVTADKLANAINTAIAANTAKTTNATHTGDVTGSGALTIAAGAVDIAHLSASGTAGSSNFLRGDNSWVTPTDTNTMGSGFTVSATTDSNATTITQGDDLMFTAGTGITCETTADGTVTITNTVSGASTATSSATGVIKLEDDTDQSVAANTVSTTAGRTYGLQLNSSDQGVVNVPWTDTNTTYSVTDGELSEINFTSADHTKLNAIEASADVTDATNVTAAGALMDSEVTNLAEVKAFADSDYATAAQGTLATNALPKAGGTMTGHVDFGDDNQIRMGGSQDLIIKHDGSNSVIADNGTGDLYLTSNLAAVRIEGKQGEDGIVVTGDGSVELYENDVKKFETTANGVTVTGTAVATTDTDTSNTGSVTLDFATNQNFVLTMTGNVTLANPSTEQVGQSGFITLIQDGSGSRTLAVGDQYFGAGGEVPTISTAANAIDVIPYIVIAAGQILLGAAQLAFSDAS